MKTTNWKTYRDGNTRYRIRAEYGLRKLGDQDPYFSMTGETQRQAGPARGGGRWVQDSFGTMPELIQKHFPTLRPLQKWHLTSITTGPTHYLANGLYWWDRAQWSEPGALSNFKKTIVLGALPNDRFPTKNATDAEVRAWLKQRLPDLMEAFYEDMRKYHVD